MNLVRNAMQSFRSTRASSPLHTAGLLLCVFFAGAAFYFAFTTLCAMVNFGWREPMFDQWNEYGTYLDRSFPQNVIQEANGHRPIIPNLIRVAEIHWFAGNQLLQLVIGGVAAYLIAAIFAISALRERQLTLAARLAAVMLSVLGVLWLANARRLLHGSEALHGYLPTLAALLASYFTYLAWQQRRIGWLAVASACCMLGTFSFGLGLASFCSLFALFAILRLPWRWLSLPLAAFVLCGLLYVVILPGDQGVRGQLRIEPLENIRLTAQWLSAPWMNGWLNNANPDSASMVDLGTRLGRYLDKAAKLLVGTTSFVGLGVGGISVLLGLGGIATFALLALRALLGQVVISRLSALAFGMGTFALASAVITVVSRLAYLHEHPDQIYADRYLAWPSLFWSSLAILLLLAAMRSRNMIPRLLGIAFLVALPIVLSATQRTGVIWGAIVYRIAAQTSAQTRSGIYDRTHFPGVAQDRDTELHEIERLRNARIAMFADPGWERVGSTWSGTLEPGDDYAVQAHWVDTVADPTADKPAGHAEGWVRHGVADLRQHGQLALLDETGTIAGLAEFSFIGGNAQALLMSTPRKRGFDGYVRAYDPDKKYTLAVLDFAANRGIALTRIAPAAAAK
jgi:hypothetical protein